MDKLGLAARVGFVALLLGLVAAAFWLPELPEGATVDLAWTRWAVIAVVVSTFAAILWLRQVKGPVKLGTDPTMLAAFGLMMLGNLIPDVGRHAVPVDAAGDLAMVAVMLVGIIVINLGEAWKKPGQARSTNPIQPGTAA